MAEECTTNGGEIYCGEAFALLPTKMTDGSIALNEVYYRVSLIDRGTVLLKSKNKKQVQELWGTHLRVKDWERSEFPYACSCVVVLMRRVRDLFEEDDWVWDGQQVRFKSRDNMLLALTHFESVREEWSSISGVRFAKWSSISGVRFARQIPG